VIEVSSLLTDRYELTMLDAAIQAGTFERECVFEAFARRLPHGRRYGIVAGTGRLLELIEQFRFRDEEYLPNSPILVVDASFAEGVILETLVLSVLNYDSSVASAAARMVSAAHGRPLAEMGSRRTGERSAVAAARAAYIAGFDATSNLEAGRSWGIPTMGTAAHAFTLLHDSEEDAFRAQVEALGSSTTLLVDTFDVEKGVETAVKVAGTGLGAVRLDSGDLPALVVAVREQLDSLGATETKITVTSDLDEYTIAALSASPVDSYGVGTSVVTGSGYPAAGMVYKLVAHTDGNGEWVSVAKKSAEKETVGGRKHPVRRHDASGHATAEAIHIGETLPEGERGRDLLVPLVVDGVTDARYLGHEGVAAARAHREKAVAELPDEAVRLGRGGEPVIPTLYF
jgi:nicotinate phosphoribosyltransferase